MGIRALLAVVAVPLLVGVAAPLVGAAKRYATGGSAPSHCALDTCAVATALEDACPCEDATRHRHYVRCVRHAAKGLTADGTIAHGCRGRLVRLAAQSLCGRPNEVACLVPTSTCDDGGSCVNDPNVDCVDDTDCGTQCETTTPNDCDARNGISTPAGSCTTAGCFSPSGAFLDG